MGVRGRERSRLPGLLRRSAFLLLVVGTAAVCLAGPQWAAAATYTLTCPAADDSCKALAERLEADVAATEANGAKLDEISDKLDPATAPAEIAGTVALSASDRDRLDLGWWGIWFLAGVTLCLLFSQLWHRVWKFWR